MVLKPVLIRPKFRIRTILLANFNIFPHTAVIRLLSFYPANTGFPEMNNKLPGLEEGGNMKIISTFLMLLLFISCDSGENNNTNTTNSTNTNNTSATNNTNQLQVDLVNPVAIPAFIFEFRGKINTADALSTGTHENALGFNTLFTGQVEQEYDDRPVINEYQNSDGTEYIVISSLLPLESIENPYESVIFAGTYSTMYIYLPTETLRELKNNDNKFIQGAQIGEHLYTEVFLHLDNTYFYKRCITLLGTDNPENLIEIDYTYIDDFDAGEVLTVRGNVEFSPDLERIQQIPGLEQDNGKYCYYIARKQVVSKEDFYSQLEEIPSLECELPVDMLASGNDKYLIGQFRGPIVERVGNGNETPGWGDFTGVLSEGEIDVSSYTRFATWVLSGDDAEITLSLLGDYRVLGSDNISLNITELTFSRNGLVGELSESNGVMNPDSLIGFNMYKYEYKRVNGSDYRKICPMALPIDNPQNSIYLCAEENTNFGIGEELQIALNLALTDDASEVMSAYQITESCVCDNTQEYVDCTVMEAK